MAQHARNRLVLLGAYVTMAGGLFLALTYVADPPGAIGAIGVVLFVGGIVLIGIGGGLRQVWRAFWTLFP